MYQAPRFFKSQGVRRTLTLSAASLTQDDEHKKALHMPVPIHPVGFRHHLVARPRLRFHRSEIDDVTRIVFGPGPHKFNAPPSTLPTVPSPLEEDPIEIPSPGSDSEPGLPLRLHENPRINTAIVQMASNLLEKPEVQESLAEELARWELIDIPGGAAIPILKADSETIKLAQCLQQLPPVTPTTACLRVSTSPTPDETNPMLAVAPGPGPVAEHKADQSLGNSNSNGNGLSLGGSDMAAMARKEGEAEASSAPASARQEGEEQQTKDKKKKKHHKHRSHKKEEPLGLIARIARWIKATIFGVLPPEKEKRKSKVSKKHKPQERKAGDPQEDDGLVMEQLDEEIEEQQQKQQEQQQQKEADKSFPWAQAAVGVALGILVLLVFRRTNPGQFMKLVAMIKRS